MPLPLTSEASEPAVWPTPCHGRQPDPERAIDPPSAEDCSGPEEWIFTGKTGPRCRRSRPDSGMRRYTTRNARQPPQLAAKSHGAHPGTRIALRLTTTEASHRPALLRLRRGRPRKDLK